MAKTKFTLKALRQSHKQQEHTTVEGVLNQVDQWAEKHRKIANEATEKAERIRAFRQEVSRQSAIVNKRMKRLEEKGLTDTPAYMQYIRLGAEPFSIRGKSYQEVQRTMGEVRSLIEATTSTIRGATNYYERMAENTGLEYESIKELQQTSPVFFELHSKIEQYLGNLHDIASAIDYEQIWTAINEYVEANKVDLANSKQSLEKMAENIGNALAGYEKPINVEGDSYLLRN